MKIRLSLVSVALALGLTALGCAFPHHQYNLPPAAQLMEPGPGVGGPGPGVLPPTLPPQMIPVSMPSVQVLFARPEGMQIRFDVSGMTAFDSTPLVVPGRQNFPQNGLYRLKLTNIPGREGTELYPTAEIGPTTPRSEAFLAHNAIPIQFTEEDFDQVVAGNFVTKVIYLPDPRYQELAIAGVETLVSTRLEPGVDPVLEADKRGTILLIVRLGAIDLEMPAAGTTMGAVSGPGTVVIPGGASTTIVTPPGTFPPGAPVLPPGSLPPGAGMSGPPPAV